MTRTYFGRVGQRPTDGPKTPTRSGEAPRNGPRRAGQTRGPDARAEPAGGGEGRERGARACGDFPQQSRFWDGTFRAPSCPYKPVATCRHQSPAISGSRVAATCDQGLATAIPLAATDGKTRDHLCQQGVVGSFESHHLHRCYRTYNVLLGTFSLVRTSISLALSNRERCRRPIPCLEFPGSRSHLVATREQGRNTANRALADGRPECAVVVGPKS